MYLPSTETKKDREQKNERKRKIEEWRTAARYVCYTMINIHTYLYAYINIYVYIYIFLMYDEYISPR